jgi:histidine triad (HIT) family protein
MDCIFCQILSKDLQASIVWQDDRCTAFMDIQPVNPGHLLVVPNVHAAELSELDEESAAHLMRVAHRLNAALRASGLRCEGVNYFLADSEAAMQEVFHVHLHVFPRFAGDGFGLKFSPAYFQRPERPALETAAAQIRAALQA